ncbi:MAG: saccharopine dehydrogenase NADP-binding domain-containing protein [Bacteroidia bacterium]
MEEKNNILIVGGYGNVGKHISNILAERFPGKIIVSGRSLDKAKKFVESSKESMIPTEFDINSPDQYVKVLKNVKVVISAIEVPENTSFVRACLSRGIHYTEIATSFETMNRLLPLNQLAKSNHVSLIPGTGLMPGLSNLMGFYLANQLNYVMDVNIYVMLGLGDEHGTDAIRWMLESSDKSFKVIENNKPKWVKALQESRRTRILSEKRQRQFFRFGFADQFILLLTTDTSGASSWVGFDSRFFNSLISIGGKIGLIKWLKLIPPQKIKKWLSYSNLGSDNYMFQCEVLGYDGSHPKTLIGLVSGQNEAKTTGIIGAFTVMQLFEGNVPLGVNHLEYCLQAESLFSFLQNYDVNFQFNEIPCTT